MLFIQNKKLRQVLLFTAFLLSGSLFAANQYVIAPNCLVEQAALQKQILGQKDGLQLLSVDDKAMQKLILNKIHQKTPCGGFVNVTEAMPKSLTQQNKNQIISRFSFAPKSQTPSSYQLSHPEEVKLLLAQINPQEMWTNLTVFSSFYDRYSNSDLGVKAAIWIKSTLETMAKDANRGDVKIYLVNTGKNYSQPSVVMKIGESDLPGVVVSAHMDTLSSEDGIKPGADDDGSGTVTALEVAKTLLTSSVRFKKPIYLIWYSAEEMGLIGSQFVVADFKAKNIPVENVLHFDMTGYAYQNDPTMWLLTDFTNKDLTAYLAKLINTYVKKPVNYTKCGYACSDHATWTFNGISSGIAFESKFGQDDPYIHTSEDTMAILSLEHMTDYAKLGVAFVAELADPVKT